ncbi:hypothetical protein SAMN05192569_103131 [Parageobacillus thermantarcticus]|uniref:Lipoprotein n=1 Tax=Parageobacillus thermantarcticus TaxID=186116 RepID=A0A1I0TIL4_9BACL|nr:hypothetical protein [Parageobacillus thermantarcticus]SFA51632.1 hypothetical protein SAMN05192569_103131 [Parageobacillus thermantarcticus]
MKWTWKPLITAAIVVVLASGCGTKETNEVKQTNPSNNDTNQTKTVQSDTNANQTETAQSHNTGQSEASQPSSKNETNVSENGATNAGESKQQETRPSEMQLSYTVDGKEVKETATLKTSDNQNFSLYVLKGWELDAEEPNSDVLMRDNSFVRIRLLQTEENETDYAKLAEEHAQAVSSDAARQDGANLPESLKGAVWYKAHSDNMTVHVIGTSNPVPMLVIIQTPKDQEELSPILAMIETIRKTDSAKPGDEAASTSSSN